jgi:hypothetical protein
LPAGLGQYAAISRPLLALTLIVALAPSSKLQYFISQPIQQLARTDKHKVLQILINLVRNAKYACDESGRSDKQLILRATHGAGRGFGAVFTLELPCQPPADHQTSIALDRQRKHPAIPQAIKCATT